MLVTASITSETYGIINTVDSLYLDFGISRLAADFEEKIWSFFKRRNLTSGNKLFWMRGEIVPQEQFLPFSTIFLVYIFNLRSKITYLFVKIGCSICISSVLQI